MQNKIADRFGTIRVVLDRLCVVAKVPWARRPPKDLEGFRIAKDSFVRAQTSIKTYGRCRQYTSLTNGARIYWQYDKQHGWLASWKITLVADDLAGLSCKEINRVLRHCRTYRILMTEIAIDFGASTGVNRAFVRKHAKFGKSRWRKSAVSNVAYYGGRRSGKLVRCYFKPGIGFRIELELHSPFLRSQYVAQLRDVPSLAFLILPDHFQFVRTEWLRLRGYLLRRFRQHGFELFARAEDRAPSLRKLNAYLRRIGVNNRHRFFSPLPLNKKVEKALEKWSRGFQEQIRWV